MVSAPLVQLYYTQFIGDLDSIPTIKATAGFKGIALIDSDPYAVCTSRSKTSPLGRFESLDKRHLPSHN